MNVMERLRADMDAIYQPDTEDDYYRHIGRRIREEREARGWSQLRLAVEMGRDYGTAVSYWESATRRPSAYDLDRLERMLGQVRP